MNSIHREVDGGYSASSMWDNQGEATLALSPTLQALLHGRHVVYAMRLPDGVIKIGCTKNLANRSFGLHGQIIGFTDGDFEDEASIHEALVAHRARGHEYYHPSPEVMAVVNEMRDHFNLPHIAA